MCLLMDISQPTYFKQTFTGRPPFFASYPFAWYDMISGKRPQRPETLTNEGLWKLVQRCWKQDPGDRPTTSELLEFFRTSYVLRFLY